MSLLEYDYEELAHLIQTGLTRLAANFLRSHGAVRPREVADYHGFQHLEYEIDHDGHRLHVRQFARLQPDGSTPAEIEEFESTFDGKPCREVDVAVLVGWLAGLPKGESAGDPKARESLADNPLAQELAALRGQQVNPFLKETSELPSLNPFAPAQDKEGQRQALRRWLEEES